MNVLQNHANELMSAIQKVHPLEKVAVSLKNEKMISQEDYNNFFSLDPDPNHLNPALKARYLLHVALLNIGKDQTNIISFIELLNNYEVMKPTCHCLLNEIAGNVEKNVCIAIGLDDKDTLKEEHINQLAYELYEVSHKWEEIGITLGLIEAEIEECRNCRNNGLKFYRVLIHWFKKYRNVNLKTLKKALGSAIVGQAKVSENLTDIFREKVLSKITPQTLPQTDLSCSDSLDNLQVADGKSMLLEAQNEYIESAEYSWIKNGQSLSDGPIYSGVSQNIIFIKYACQGLEGKYSCRIKGREDKSITKKLSVIFTPEKRYFLDFYSDIPEISKDSWPPVGTSSYIKLALINEDRPIDRIHDDSVRGDMDDILKEKNKEEYKVLFEQYDAGALFLVEGRPGSGKTTLTRKLCKDWATGPDILQGLNLLVLISLRILTTNNKENFTLFDILEQLYSTACQQLKIANIIEETHGKGCCFIVDGLDEYEDRNNPQTFIYKLLHHKYLPQAMVIVASRPIGSVHLRRIAKISKRIEVLGFSKESIFSYIKSYFLQNKHKIKADELIHYLKLHINLLHLCYLPVHTAMICFIYQQPCEEIPVTETKMYEFFTLLTIKRKLEHDNNSQYYDSLKELRGIIRVSFQIVCKLAFDMTIQSKQTISLEPNKAFLSKQDSDLHSLGLVTIDKTAKLFGYKDLYSFLHLTFQEFLAAYHIHMCPVEEQLEIIERNVNKKEMLLVWKFFCGSSTFDSQNNGLYEIMKSQHSNDLYRIQCAFESQQKTVCDLVFESKETRSLEFIDHAFLPTDLNALAFTCSQTSTPVTRLIFKGCILDETGALTFIDKVDHKKLEHITSLIFSIKTDSKDQFKAIRILLNKCHSVNELCLKNTKIGLKEVEILTDNIKLPNLKYLEIYMPLKTQGLWKCTCEEIFEKISFCSSNLKEIRYAYDEFSKGLRETHKKCLIHLLKSFKCKIRPLGEIPINTFSNLNINEVARVPKFLGIPHLILVNCNISDLDMNYFKNLDGEKLESLWLDFNKLTCKGATVLSRFLQKCTKLTKLSLSCNMIDDSGAMTISHSLLLPTSTLLDLDMEGNSFGDQGALALAEAANGMCVDFRLKLGNRQISEKIKRHLQKFSPTVEMDEEGPICASKFIGLSNPDHIEKAIQCYKNKLTINLSNQMFCHSAAKAIARGIKHCQFLQTLNLSNCYLMGMNDLFRNIHICFALTKLDLFDNRISKDSVIKSIKGLKSCIHLKELNLGSNYIEDKGVECIAYHLKDIQLEILNLSWTSITADGAAALARWLRISRGLFRYESDEHISKYPTLDTFLVKKLNEHVKRQEMDSDGVLHKQQGKWCDSLLELNLSGNDIRCEGAAALGYGLKCCRKLEILNLQGNKIKHDGSEFLFKGLKECTSLKSLRLDDNRIQSLGYWFQEMGKSVQLQELSLKNNVVREFTPSEARFLLQGLRNCSDLKILNLDCNNICLNGATALCQALNFLTRLEELKIKNVGKNTGIIMKGITNSHKLKLLHLQNNIVDLECHKLLATSNQHDQLVDLNISNTELHTIHGSQLLSGGLKHCPNMQILDLSSNKLDSSDIRLLSEGIVACRYLKKLDLSLNDFDSVGTTHLAEAINGISNLTTINLNDNKIDSEGAVNLMTAIEHCTEVKTLQFQCNNIGPRGAAAIAHWIIRTSRKRPRKISNLLILNIAKNVIKAEGAEAIATALKFCKNLSFLDLSGNYINSEASTALITGLKHCPQLRTLHLNSNQLGNKGVNLLEEGLINCRSLNVVSLSDNEIARNKSLTKFVMYNCRIKYIYI